jgi:ADP-heptose:LPS heptosyltransferase
MTVVLKIFYVYLVMPLVRFFHRPEVKKPLDEEYKNILINLGEHASTALGDILLANTLIAVVKERYPNAHISLLIDKRNSWLERFWKNHSLLDDYVVHPSITIYSIFRWVNFYACLRHRKFDLCFIMISNANIGLKTRWFPLDPIFLYFIARTKSIVGQYSPFNQDKLMRLQFYFDLEGPHWTDQLSCFARSLGLPEDKIKIAAKPAFRFTRLNLTGYPEKIKVAINHGGGRHLNRRWPIENYKSLCLKLVEGFDAMIILLGGGEEFEEREEIAQFIKERIASAVVINVSNEPLNETASFIAGSSIFIGNDSGPTHLAAAVETPIVAIFGPTSKALFGPDKISRKHTVVATDLECQPCQLMIFKTGNFGCARTTEKYKCLVDIEAEVVYEVAKNKIQAISKKDNSA